jgi:hypothetical protein
MGIDIYLAWEGQTAEERRGQIAGFSVTAGRAGYLREAYHGGPYATEILVREAFDSPSAEAQIPAATMRERLTNVTEPSRSPGLRAGDAMARVICEMLSEGAMLEDAVEVDGHQGGPAVTEPETVEECVRIRCARIYPDMEPDMVERYVQSFRDFVALAELKERETGKPCTVIASY